MAMRKRVIWVIEVKKKDGWKEHSRTSDRFESMKTYDALLKAGLKAGSEVSVGPKYF